MAEKKAFVQLLRLGEVPIPVYHVLVGYVCLQHGGCLRCDLHSLHHHGFLEFLNYNLQHAVGFVCGASFAVVKKSATDSGKKDRNNILSEQVKLVRTTSAKKKSAGIRLYRRKR